MNYPTVHEQIEALTNELTRIADAIIPSNCAAGTDAMGGRVESLTEAVMGVTRGLSQVCESIDHLAGVVDDLRRKEDFV